MENQQELDKPIKILKDGFKPGNVSELIEVIDLTDHEFLKKQIRDIVEKDNLEHVVLYTDEGNQGVIQQIQMWSDKIVYIAYRDVLRGMMFTCAMRNPPEA